MKTTRRSSRRPAMALLMLTAALVLSVSLPGAVQAQVTGIFFDGSPGTGAPPATLGPYMMQPFPADGRPEYVSVTDVPGPTGNLAFDQPMSHRLIGSGWATWSHGYTGDVYASDGTQVVMTLPPDTAAFYFYAEPNQFAVYNVTATAEDGTTSGPIAVDGYGGAKYFGFYARRTHVSHITVDVEAGALGFAVGEFGIASVPVGGYTEPRHPLALSWHWLTLAGLGVIAAIAHLTLRRRTA